LRAGAGWGGHISASFVTIGLLLLAILVVASATGYVLHVRSEGRSETINNLNARIRAWWGMAIVMFGALLLGSTVTLIVFAVISMLALREFLTLTPTRETDYWPLFIAFFIAVPGQYILLAMRWYGLFAVFIPVYVFGLVSFASALAQDTESFFQRNSMILFAVMVCVYGVSHAPGILILDIAGFEGRNAELLFFFLFTAQLCDVLQYVFGKLFGRRRLAPAVTPSKTWEGLIGGGIAAILVAGALHVVTPFGVWGAMAYAAQIVVCGALGGLVLSAVKRSLGAKDWGAALSGHGGFMDRLDSVAFSAPVFFHLVRYFWA
jgi:phosphatidate cytidylyltransferase